ncbi:AmmeMemoRadiSam system protein A [Candidatus Micrarchaeota archaeon]|nr:AmmeMemoRadiSam system protein A [Candidatus Micrarchaeota archaeon]
MAFSAEERRFLLSLARNVIKHYFSGIRYPIDKAPKNLLEKRGVFVTLTKNSQLRGCIGYPLPTESLAQAVVDNAINAAFHDPRFEPLKQFELDKIELEITVLTIPKRLEFKTPEELLKKIKLGRDGLIITLGGYKGLFLPQVPIEQGWDKAKYVSHLCMKAGLHPNTWLNKKVVVESFQGLIIREHDESKTAEKRK